MIIVFQLISLLLCFSFCYAAEQPNFVSRYPAEVEVYLPPILPTEYTLQRGYVAAQAYLDTAFANWNNFDVAYAALNNIALPAGDEDRQVRFPHTPYLQAILASNHGKSTEFVIKHLHQAYHMARYRITGMEQTIANHAKNLLRMYANDGNNLARKYIAQEQCKSTSSAQKYSDGFGIAFEQLEEIQRRFATTNALTADDKKWLEAMILNASDIMEDLPTTCEDALWFCTKTLNLPLFSVIDSKLQQYQLLLRLVDKDDQKHIYQRFVPEAAQALQTLAPMPYHKSLFEGLRNIKDPRKARHGCNQLVFVFSHIVHVPGSPVAQTIHELIPHIQNYMQELVDSPTNNNPYLQLLMARFALQNNWSKEIVVKSLRLLDKHLAACDYSTGNNRLRHLVDEFYATVNDSTVQLFRLTRIIKAHPEIALDRLAKLSLNAQDFKAVSEFEEISHAADRKPDRSYSEHQKAAIGLLRAMELLHELVAPVDFPKQYKAIALLMEPAMQHPDYKKTYGPRLGDIFYQLVSFCSTIKELDIWKKKAEKYQSPKLFFASGCNLLQKRSKATQAEINTAIQQIEHAAEQGHFDACMTLSHAFDPANIDINIKKDRKKALYYAQKIIAKPGENGLLAQIRCLELDSNLTDEVKDARIQELESKFSSPLLVMAIVKKHENNPARQHQALQRSAIFFNIPSAQISLAKQLALGQCPESKFKPDINHKDLRQATELLLLAMANANPQFIHDIDSDLQLIKRQFSPKKPAEQAMLEQINAAKNAKNAEHAQLIAEQYQGAPSATSSTSSTTQGTKSKPRKPKKR